MVGEEVRLGGFMPNPPSVSVAPEETIRVAVVAEDPFVRGRVGALLRRLPGFEVTVPDASGGGAGSHVAGACSTVVVVNPVPVRAAGPLVQGARERLPGARVVVMNPPVAGGDLVACIRAGAEGFILPDAPVDELPATIRLVARGTKVLPDRLLGPLFRHLAQTQPLAPRVVGGAFPVGLTAREGEIAMLVAEGLTNKAIASRLGIGVHTVKTHVHNILEKLGLNSRLQLAVLARRVAVGAGASRWMGQG